MVLLGKAIIIVSNILFGRLVVRALCSWLMGSGRSWVQTIYRISAGLTEFLVAPCRKITSKFNGGMFDWSLLLACLVIMLARDILLKLIMMLS